MRERRQKCNMKDFLVRHVVKACNFRKGTKNCTGSHSEEALLIISCQPVNQIQKVLDHGHLLTVHDPEQESSELDTVILKALVKGEIIVNLATA